MLFLKKPKEIEINYRYLVSEEIPIIVCDLPTQILKEVSSWVKFSKKIKNHPLADIKSHENCAYREHGKYSRHNSYQCSIDPNLIENSFWLAYTLRIAATLYGKSHRDFQLRKWDGHFDNYDIWTNFSYYGDCNPPHTHGGSLLGGVIYYKNHNHPTIFPNHDIEYEGKNGTMLLFPNDYVHAVDTQTKNKERITIAFNITEVKN